VQKLKPKKNKATDEGEEKVPLKDIYNRMKEMKADIDHKYGSIEKKVEAFEQQISSMETTQRKCERRGRRNEASN